MWSIIHTFARFIVRMSHCSSFSMSKLQGVSFVCVGVGCVSKLSHKQLNKCNETFRDFSMNVPQQLNNFGNNPNKDGHHGQLNLESTKMNIFNSI